MSVQNSENMTKIPKTSEESKSETDQVETVNMNRKVSQLAERNFKFLCDTFIDGRKCLCFRAITKTKSRYWKSVDVTGSITVWTN